MAIFYKFNCTKVLVVTHLNLSGGKKLMCVVCHDELSISPLLKAKQITEFRHLHVEVSRTMCNIGATASVPSFISSWLQSLET